MKFVKTTLFIAGVLFAFGAAVSAQGIFDQYKNKAQDKVNEAKNKVEQKTKSEVQDKASTESMQGDGKVWGFVATTVSVKKGFKTSSRLYVSEITEVPLSEFKKFDNNAEEFKSHVREYFVATVIAAAKARGEEISEPDDYSINGIVCKFTVESYVKSDFYTTAYRYKEKSALDEPLKEQVGYAKDSSRPVFYFRWDPTGKNANADLEREGKRTSGELPSAQ